MAQAFPSRRLCEEDGGIGAKVLGFKMLKISVLTEFDEFRNFRTGFQLSWPVKHFMFDRILTEIWPNFDKFSPNFFIKNKTTEKSVKNDQTMYHASIKALKQ